MVKIPPSPSLPLKQWCGDPCIPPLNTPPPLPQSFSSADPMADHRCGERCMDWQERWHYPPPRHLRYSKTKTSLPLPATSGTGIPLWQNLLD